MFDHPLSLQGIFIQLICQFSQQNAKKQYLQVNWQKIAQQAKKIARTCLRRLRVFIILHTTTEVLMISMMKTRELKFLSSLYLFRKSVPVNVSLSQVAKDKAPVTHDAPTLPAGLPCLLWPRVPPPSWHRRPYLAVLSLSTPQRCSLFCPLDTRLPATCLPDLHSPGVLPNGA